MSSCSDSDKLPFDVPLNVQKTVYGFQFTAIKYVGRGSFGVVYKVTSPEYTEPLAMKLVLQDRRYKNREYQLISSFDHPCVTVLRKGILAPIRGSEDYLLYIFMDYYPETVTSFYRQITACNRLPTIRYVKLIVFYTARALAYLHRYSIVHRDLKPTNILIDPQTMRVALCDFGSAKIVSTAEPNIAYICSRHYRAPELCLGQTVYGGHVDIWGLGCILGELLNGKALFPGDGPNDQMVRICKIMGAPKQTDFPTLKVNKIRMNSEGIGLKRFFAGKDSYAIALLEKCLVYNPEKRLTALQIMQDAFFDELRYDAGLSWVFNCLDREYIDASALARITGKSAY